MKTPAVSKEDVIEFQSEPVSPAAVSAFNRATRTEHNSGIPATFPTIFRTSEFQWLDRMKVDMRKLLHTDQEYQYLRPLELGQAPIVRTRLKTLRERAGKQGPMTFVTLESEVLCDGVVCVVVRTTFVVRQSLELGSTS